MTSAAAKLEVVTSFGLEEDAFTKKNALFDLGVKVTQNVAQYPLNHVTYAATKFEAATSNSLGGDTFTRKMMDTGDGPTLAQN